MLKSWIKAGGVCGLLFLNAASWTVLCSLYSPTAEAQISVLTAHNDVARTGQNLNETTLTRSNVNSTQFGKLFSQSIMGGVYAQPLYLPQVVIPGKGTHNVIYVATTSDYVYAIDGDFNGGLAATPLWQVSLLTNATPSGTYKVGYGIIGTPVIDPPSNTMYVVSSEILSSGSHVTRLHALNLGTGAEKLGGPLEIQGSVPGTGSASSGGILKFDSDYEVQRPALLFLNGVLYVTFGSLNDNGPWHGWIFSYKYNASTKSMQRIDIFCTTADGAGAGIWMGGSGPAAEVYDSAKPYGRMLLTTGNGSFTASTPYTGSMGYGMSVLDLDLTDGKMTVRDTFTPYNEHTANANDGDLGSGGPILLPTETMASGMKLNGLLQVGKTGTLYLLDRDNSADGSNDSATEYSPAGLGGFNASADKIVQKVQTPESGAQDWGAGVWGTEAYWNNTIYVGGTNPGVSNSLVAYSYSKGVLSTLPTSQSAELFSFPGPTPSISAEGINNAILWAIKTDGLANSQPAVLLAYDATNLENLLYTSNTELTRDSPSVPEPFIVPTIAHGKVYVATNGLLNVYGLLADTPVTPAPVISPSSGTFTGSEKVAIADSVSGATIYYTTGGTEPTPASAVYLGPISVSKTETINAIASSSAALLSPVASATFTSTADTPNPVFSLAAGTYNGAQTVKVTDSNSESVIYYTVDGAKPSTSSSAYKGPISIPVSETVQAMAVAPNLLASSVVSAAYAIGPVYTFNFSQGFANAKGPIQFNGTTDLDDFRLQLTNGGLNQDGSAFYTTKVNVQAFTTDFTFQLSNPMGDGITFTIQNSSPQALGVSGAGLGYQKIPHSVAIKFDLTNNVGEGTNSTGIYLDGAIPTVPSVNLTGTGIDLHSGDYMNVHLTYDGTDLNMTITDAVTLASWSHTFLVNIPAAVNGDTAYVGFTGGTGAQSASQKVTYWTWTPGTPVVPNYPAGFDAANLRLNGATLSGTRLQLTTGSESHATTVFYSTPVADSSFSSTFNFQVKKGSTSTIGNGFTFVLQNHGLGTVGGTGLALGYQYIPNSVAVSFDVMKNNTTLYINGEPTSTSTSLTDNGLNIANGDIFQVTFTYDGTTLRWNIRDANAIVTNYSRDSVAINIPQSIGSNTAYVGFTAGTSTATAIIDILDWTFTNP
jgi:hypothetical protein